MDKLISFFKNLKPKNRFMLISFTALLGILLVVLSPGISTVKTDSVKKAAENDETHEYKLSLEKQLKETLENVVGVGQVQIMITLSGEITKDVVYNETVSSSGSSQSSQNQRTTKEVVMEKTGSGATPYSSSEIYPSVMGVIVVAQGADDPKVAADITEAVKVALGVAAHKIVVLTQKE